MTHTDYEYSFPSDFKVKKEFVGSFEKRSVEKSLGIARRYDNQAAARTFAGILLMILLIILSSLVIMVFFSALG